MELVTMYSRSLRPFAFTFSSLSFTNPLVAAFSNSYTTSLTSTIKLPSGALFQPYQMDLATWEKIQEGTYALKKRNPLAGDVLSRIEIEGMSLGSISAATHGHIAKTIMALAGVKTYADLANKMQKVGLLTTSNSGEGGDINQHAVKQIASSRFGVTLEYVIEAAILQFKAAQGVKPGVGGAIAGIKVTELIAFLRHCQPWTDLFSPGPHHDQYSIEDFAQIVKDYSSANPNLGWSAKLASEPAVGTIAIGVVKAMGLSEQGKINNFVVTGKGATGNTPLFTKYHTTYPWIVGLANTHWKLTQAGLRSSVSLTVSGGVTDFFDAFMWGADKVGIGTVALIADGCTMQRRCHDNTCSVGVATQDPLLVAKNTGSPLSIARVLWALSELTAIKMAPYFDTVEQAIGRAPDILTANFNGPLTGHGKYLERFKMKPRFVSLGKLPAQTGPSYTERQMIEKIRQENVADVTVVASNSDLAFGGRLSYYTVTDPDIKKLANTTGITLRFTGLATGQSLGVLGAPGLTFDASQVYTNDGTAKSLSGAVVYAASCGNQAGFGMTRGALHTRYVGSRGAIRKSGGVFSTEYMGSFGINFGTDGLSIVYGNVKNYPNLVVEDYKPPVIFKKNALGFGFLSGFSGGSIVMPVRLWQEALTLKHVSPTICEQIAPKFLSVEDKKNLMLNLEQSAYKLSSPLQKALCVALKQNFNLIDEWFIKLEAPKAKIIPYTAGLITLAEEKLPAPSITSSSQIKQVSPVPAIQSTKVILSPLDRDSAACGTGLVMDLDNQASHAHVQTAVTALQRLEHRGAGGVDPLSGDGCGVLVTFGKGFFEAEFPDLKLKHGNFAVMAVFMPQDIQEFKVAEKYLVVALEKFGLVQVGKREVPIDHRKLGIQAKADNVKLMHYIVPMSTLDSTEFDNQLAKAHLYFELAAQIPTQSYKAHCCSASRRYVIYKTKGKEKYIADIYADLRNPLLSASLVLIHSRFATNTETLIENVQPLFFGDEFNGEINNIPRFIECIKFDKELGQLLGIDLQKISFSHYSDSAIMAIYMKMLQLKNYTNQQIHHAIFHAYAPLGDNAATKYHNLMQMPGLEGPNGSIRIFESGDIFEVMIEMDTMGWRPHRGLMDTKRRLLVTGSELGIVSDLQGDLIDLGPGEALHIDVTNQVITPFELSAETQQKYQDKLTMIDKLPISSSYENPPLVLDDLADRKLRAGITAEIEKTLLIPMFQDGKGLTVSMGDDGAPEVTVSGPTRIINTIHTSFAQITRPPLDYQRESEMMNSLTFVGAKPALETFHHDTKIAGYYVENPIIDNHQLQVLVNTAKFYSRVVDITYRVCERKPAMLAALDKVIKSCLAAAEDNVALIVLSDLKTDANYASLLPLLVAGSVNHALIEAGVRHKVTLCLQSAICSTPLELVAAKALGIEIINPYLIFAPDSLFYSHREEFVRQRESYRKIACKEILAAAARAGIRTLSSGYHRAGQITALGLDEDVANFIGIYSELGGFDWANIAAASVDMHIRPTDIGKFLNTGQAARVGKFNVALVADLRAIATGEKTLVDVLPSLTQNIEESRKDNLEGWFDKKDPQIWTEHNPMTIIIVGGGAAGFLQAQALLNSAMGKKIRIKMIEENPANLFGLVKDGIAPDKRVTKEAQFTLLGQCVTDERFKYYGGVEVGKNGNVTVEELKKDYSVVIDCRGAPQDRQLTEVEGHELFIAGSKVWKAYNGYFDPLNAERYWPFREHTHNQAKIVIGSGNVAADIIRLLLTKAENFDDAEIHPVFQQRLRKQGPRFIRNFARGSVLDCKITLKELESFEKNDISVFASFEEHDINEAKLSKEQLKKLQFFRLAKRKVISPSDQRPRVHFHFGCVPVKAEYAGRNILEIKIKNQNDEIETYQPGDIITAVGTEHPSDEFDTGFAAGWAAGNGGNLSITQDTVATNTAKILALDEMRDFDHKKGPAPERDWQLRASVTNQGFLNILAYRKAGNRIDTEADWRKARDYSVVPSSVLPAVNLSESAAMLTLPSSVGADEIAITDNNKIMKVKISGKSASVYALLKEAAETNTNIPIPQNECDEQGNCMRCVAEVITPKSPVQHMPLEKAQLFTLFGNKAKNKILTCQQSAVTIAKLGSTLKIEHPAKKRG
jgi:glutamate synthase domain-containing protein 2/glutamate synthase domain-containing protein 1